MYDEILLQERMAELNLNSNQIAKRAGIDQKTAKNFVTTGRAQPKTVAAVAKVLRLKIPDMVKRHNGKRKSA